MPESKNSKHFVDVVSRFAVLFGKTLYFVIALTLLGISIGVIGYSLWNVWAEIRAAGDPMRALLEAVGLTVLALAVIDVSKYLFDEEVIRSRELRAAAEARLRRLLGAGRRLQNAEDPLGCEARARLPGAAGLSPEGVALALAATVVGTRVLRFLPVSLADEQVDPHHVATDAA